MEILQTIWNILINENETLTKIICSPLTFLEAYVSVLIFTKILKIKTNSKITTIYVLSFSIIALISMFFIPAPYYTFINVLACPILVFFIFKTSIIKSILAEIIPYIFFFIVSSILVTIWIKITNLPSEYFMKIPIYKICFTLVMHSTAILFYLIFDKFSINISLLDKMKKGHNFTIYISLLIRNYSYSFTVIYSCSLY